MGNPESGQLTQFFVTMRTSLTSADRNDLILFSGFHSWGWRRGLGRGNGRWGLVYSNRRRRGLGRGNGRWGLVYSNRRALIPSRYFLMNLLTESPLLSFLNQPVVSCVLTQSRHGVGRFYTPRLISFALHCQVHVLQFRFQIRDWRPERRRILNLQLFQGRRHGSRNRGLVGRVSVSHLLAQRGIISSGRTPFPRYGL